MGPGIIFSVVEKRCLISQIIFLADGFPEKSIVEGQRTLKIGGVIQEGFFFRVYQCDRVSQYGAGAAEQIGDRLGFLDGTQQPAVYVDKRSSAIGEHGDIQNQGIQNIVPCKFAGDEDQGQVILIGKGLAFFGNILNIPEHFDSQGRRMSVVQFPDDLHKNIRVVDKNVAGGENKFSGANVFDGIGSVQNAGTPDRGGETAMSGENLHVGKRVCVLNIKKSIVLHIVDGTEPNLL